MCTFFLLGNAKTKTNGIRGICYSETDGLYHSTARLVVETCQFVFIGFERCGWVSMRLQVFSHHISKGQMLSVCIRVDSKKVEYNQGTMVDNNAICYKFDFSNI